MIKSIFFAILGVAIVVGGLLAVKIDMFKTMGDSGSGGMPPSSITAVEVQKAEWESTLSSIGTLEAAQGVVITADLPGRVSRLYFDGGERVSAGDLLVAQESTTEDAQLSAALSSLELAQSNLDRVSRLWNSRVVARSEFDAAKSQATAAQAQVDNINSSILKKQIIAPFDGRLGLRMVNIGQDLSQGVPIVSLQAFDPMRVNFSLPQRDLAKVTEGLAVRVSSNAVPDREFTGAITAINTEIDSATRTVRVQATLNVKADVGETLPELLPGMFATVDVVLPETKPVLMVPLTSISFATSGDSIFVIESDEENDRRVAQQQFVQLGERRGDFVEILKGVEEGSLIANEGVFKLRNGASVNITEGGGEKPSLTPQPDNA